jgi:hypothetical protein
VTPRTPPGRNPDSPQGSVARAARNREIARRHLAGESWRLICEDMGVSRTTAKRAAREMADEVRRTERPEELEALKQVDVEHLVHLALHANGVALRRALEILGRGKDDALTVGAMNAASRLLAGLTLSLIRLGLVEDPADAALARRAERFEAVWGRALGKAYADVPEEDFERLLGEITADARIQGGLALTTYTTNGDGRSHDGRT